MPELPEVETIRKGLEKYLVERVIEDVEVRLPKIVSGDTKNVVSATIISVRRFGKGLVIDLNNGYSITIHVKMTGQLIYQGIDIPSGSIPHLSRVGKLPGTHTHVIFLLRAKSLEQRADYLYYNDIRQFGWIRIIKSSELNTQDFFEDLGPEPLRDLTPDKFKKVLLAVKGPIKPLLMEQKKIAGVGNIYANDALYLAKIHPKRPANSLSPDEIDRLFTAIETVLQKGLDVGGASEWQYVNVLGESGGYQNFFQVYAQNGKPCSRCGTLIEKMVMGGRGTFFCPGCQSLTRHYEGSLFQEC